MKNPFKRFLHYLKAVKEKKRQRRLKTEELVRSHQKLIHEFRLIQEKKSKLSKKGKARVELKIRKLIASGHIQVVK